MDDHRVQKKWCHRNLAAFIPGSLFAISIINAYSKLLDLHSRVYKIGAVAFVNTELGSDLHTAQEFHDLIC